MPSIERPLSELLDALRAGALGTRDGQVGAREAKPSGAQGIGLWTAAPPFIGPIHLHHPLTSFHQMAPQAGAVGVTALQGPGSGAQLGGPPRLRAPAGSRPDRRRSRTREGPRRRARPPPPGRACHDGCRLRGGRLPLPAPPATRRPRPGGVGFFASGGRRGGVRPWLCLVPVAPPTCGCLAVRRGPPSQLREHRAGGPDDSNPRGSRGSPGPRPREASRLGQRLEDRCPGRGVVHSMPAVAGGLAGWSEPVNSAGLASARAATAAAELLGSPKNARTRCR